MSEHVDLYVKAFNDQSIYDQITSKYDDKIYHYTSPNGLQGILSNKTLRFTDNQFLNDETEGIYAIHLCLEQIEELFQNAKILKDEFEKQAKDRLDQNERIDSGIMGFNTYQCSFSTEGDNLSLWNYYTKGDSIKGYNLEFNANTLINSLKIPSNCEDNGPKARGGLVIYEEEKQIEILNEVISKFYEAYENDQDKDKDKDEVLSWCIGIMLDKILIIGRFFKNPCFKIESEYRIVIVPFFKKEKDKIKSMTINRTQEFFERNGLFIPYMDFEFNHEALSSITLSPTLNSSLNKKGVMKLLQKNFADITTSDIIQHSAIPVRF